MTPDYFLRWIDDMIKDCDTAASHSVSPNKEYWNGQAYGLSLVKEKYLTLSPHPTTPN